MGKSQFSNLARINKFDGRYSLKMKILKEILHGFSKSTEQLNETMYLVKVIIIKDSPRFKEKNYFRET
jgi:hypothetical protein